MLQYTILHYILYYNMYLARPLSAPGPLGKARVGTAQMGTARFSVCGLRWLIQGSFYAAGMSKIGPKPPKVPSPFASFGIPHVCGLDSVVSHDLMFKGSDPQHTRNSQENSTRSILVCEMLVSNTTVLASGVRISKHYILHKTKAHG